MVEAHKDQSKSDKAEGKAARPKRGGAPWTLTLLALLLMAGAIVIAVKIDVKYQKANSDVQLSRQYIVAALLKPAREKLDLAAQHAEKLNYGNAEDNIKQAARMFQTAGPVLGEVGSPQFFGRVSTSLTDAQKALQEMSPEASKKIRVASKQIEMAEMVVAQESAKSAREEVKRGHANVAQALLDQTTDLFEDATRTEGTEGADWKDKVADSLTEAQKALNGIADKAARKGVVDDAANAIGNVQKSMNDFADKVTPTLDQATKDVGDKMSGKDTR